MADLILQYIKALIWPITVVLLLASFRGEITSLLGGEIELDIFGVRIKGKRTSGIAELEQKAKELQNNIDALTKQLIEQQQLNNAMIAENERLTASMEEYQRLFAAVKAGQPVPASPAMPPADRTETARLAAKSEALYSAIQAQVDQTQHIVRQPKYERANSLEQQGFEALVKDQFGDALGRFTEAHNVFPDYHNVYEIMLLLRQKLDTLSSPTTRTGAKREVFSKILQDYSWGMPAGAKQQMVTYLK